jgi:hypothetical protein
LCSWPRKSRVRARACASASRLGRVVAGWRAWPRRSGARSHSVVWKEQVGGLGCLKKELAATYSSPFLNEEKLAARRRQVSEGAAGGAGAAPSRLLGSSRESGRIRGGVPHQQDRLDCGGGRF